MTFRLPVVILLPLISHTSIATGQSATTGPEVAKTSSGPSALPAGFETDRVGFQKTIQPFFARHCVSCHGPKTQKAGLRLDNISTDFGKSLVANRWTEIMDRLNAGEMPPREAAQPSTEDRSAAAQWIVTELRRREAALQSTGGRVVLRRLNRAEYINTVRDLLGIEPRDVEGLPEDPPAHGFDNIGAALLMSPMQVETYMNVAGRVLDQAIPSTPRPPKPVKWRFKMDDIYQEGEAGRSHFDLDTHRTDWFGKRVMVKLNHDKDRHYPFPRRHRGMITMTPRTSWAGVYRIRFPEGRYVVRVRAAALIPTRDEVVATGLKRLDKYARNRHDVEEMRTHFKESLDYQFGPPRLRIREENGLRRVLDEIDIDAPVDQPKVYEFNVRFDATSGGVMLGNYYSKPNNRAVRVANGRTFPQSVFFIDYVEIEGPIVEQWPPKSQVALLGPSEGSATDRARGVLKRFMPKAWRRPVSDDELQAMVDLFAQRRAETDSFQEAIKIPLLAVLSSPHFLYLVETDGQNPASDGKTDARTSSTISDYQLASRLSYFLWSSMPDDELFDLAARGRLTDIATLRAQVDRMLADKRSDQFVTNFAGQWLGLRRVGTNPPSRDLFPRYDDHLEESIVRETLGFFAEVLHNDLAVRNFIRSDFVTINERLARHYHIEGVRGDHIRRVDLPPNSRRGGLLTQASFHTTTSNGTRTSPVLRGKWVLETLLNDPPPPPPPNAGEIPQPVPGEGRVTVRKRLELHRQMSACAACHSRIDPLGFALENYRADGSWEHRSASAAGSWARDTDPVIDTTAAMPDGRQLKGLRDLQNVLLENEDQFLHCLAEKLATYALGRGMEYSDRRWIDSLVTGMKQDGKTLRTLIKHIVVSDQFRRK